MNKVEFINEFQKKTDFGTGKVLSKEMCGNLIDALTETITEVVATGDNVKLVGFGTFECRKRVERKGTNPSTGKAITIPATKTPAFKAGAAFKNTVKGN